MFPLFQEYLSGTRAQKEIAAQNGMSTAVFAYWLSKYRQVQHFTRAGIMLTESTLGDFAAATADLLAPLYDAMTEELRKVATYKQTKHPFRYRIRISDVKRTGGTTGFTTLELSRYGGPTTFLNGYEGALQKGRLLGLRRL